MAVNHLALEHIHFKLCIHYVREQDLAGRTGEAYRGTRLRHWLEYIGAYELAPSPGEQSKLIFRTACNAGRFGSAFRSGGNGDGGKGSSGGEAAAAAAAAQTTTTVATTIHNNC
jgi:hypothetical protein